MPTVRYVKCDRFREAASARLDGEPIGMSASVLDHHLATCVDCARWLADATRLTRQLRLGSAEVPDLSAQILASTVLPARKMLRRRTRVRVALLLTAIVQLAESVPSLFGGSIDMAMSMHGAHETAAWNVALGVAFAATALRPRRAAGLLPVLVVFVGALAALSIRDIAGGAVAAGRLATHLGVVIGLLLVYVLHRVEESLPPERAAVAGRDEHPSEGSGGLRGVA